jgi:hypothetical protein
MWRSLVVRPGPLSDWALAGDERPDVIESQLRPAIMA